MTKDILPRCYLAFAPNAICSSIFVHLRHIMFSTIYGLNVGPTELVCIFVPQI